MAHRHTEDFRREAVRLALTSGLPRRQVAGDLGIGLSTLSKWLRLSRDADTPLLGHTDMESELSRLRKENRILREERDILKKATAFFANQK